MRQLIEYKIDQLNQDDLTEYTNVLVDSFGIKLAFDEYYNIITKDFVGGNIFLGAKLFSSKQIIGGICLEKAPIYKNEIYIENIFVDRKYRNNGIATNLINYVIENKFNLFSMNEVNLYLFCKEQVKDFYQIQNFTITDEWNENCEGKILRMDRKI